jgi:glucose-6-phosphate isomerase
MLTLDYANCLSERVGSHGIDPTLLVDGAEPAEAVKAATAKLAQTRGTGWERWRNLAMDPVKSEHVSAVRAIVKECEGKFDTMVVLGIGGSALGNIAVQSALNPGTYNLLSDSKRPGPRLFVVDNVDPANFGRRCWTLRSRCRAGWSDAHQRHQQVGRDGRDRRPVHDHPRQTARKRLGTNFAQEHRRHHRPGQGHDAADLRPRGYVTLPVPDGVGGRFSVLSPGGLFSAAMCGIDIDALLAGAAEMDAPCSRPQADSEPGGDAGVPAGRIGHEKGKTNHVMMPYCNGLYLLADWYRQLVGRVARQARGQAGAGSVRGFTPIKALGTTDQHSQVQFYREGPNDKVLGLIEVDSFDRPRAERHGDSDGDGRRGDGVPRGPRMGELLNAEKRATEYALVESQRPNYTIRFPSIDARHVGQFIQLWRSRRRTRG